jgi:hypothetical protein
MLARDAGMDLFLDSGAYTAFKQDVIIELEKYAAYINEHGSIFSVRANLDVIGDTGPKSWDNLKALQSLGCDVLPVFHQRDEIIYLQRMLDNYQFIALGGLVGASRNELRNWLDEIWGKYLIKDDGTPRLAVHGFGLTDQVLIQRYPWASVDSSAWLFTSMMGGCLFRRGNEFIKINFSDKKPDAAHYSRLPRAMRIEVDKLIAEHGVTVEQLASHYSFRHLVNAKTYQEMELLAVPTFKFAPALQMNGAAPEI